MLVASEERKRRVEVNLQDLSPAEKEQFLGAKQKEVKAWIDHRTVRKVAAGTLDDNQLFVVPSRPSSRRDATVTFPATIPLGPCPGFSSKVAACLSKAV